LKQDRINKALTVSLLGLLTILALLLVFQNRGDEIDKEIFKIPELSAVDRIILDSSNGQVELKFNGAKWNVNDQFVADEQLITVLFATLQQIEPKRLVSTNARDSLKSILACDGVRVILYAGDKEVKNFFAGGNSAKTVAYFSNEENGPHVMTIPGYKVYGSGVFEVDEMGWRDKRIFNFNWRNFKKLRATFADQPLQSFEIEDLGSGFNLVNSPPSDTTKLNDYLDAVSLLVAKQFVPADSEAYDSLRKAKVQVTIDVFDLGNNIYKLELFAPLSNELNVMGKLGSGDEVLFDQRQVSPILKTRDYFRDPNP